MPDPFYARRVLGRDGETALLDSLLRRAREGRGGGVVLHGEPGIGKTALLSYAEERATGFRLLRAVGVAPEADLPYATLHQLLLPALDAVDELPGPQAQALSVLFGRAHGTPPDPFLVGLSALSLLSLWAGEQPVLCVIDDAHWADQPTLKTVAFVARRLDNEPVVVALAARADEGHDTDLPALRRVPLMGLKPDAARALLAGRRLSDGEQRRLLAVTGGNPLALLELAGREPHPEGAQQPPAMTEELQRSFLAKVMDRHAAELPLLQLIAADGSGSVDTVERAAATLRIPSEPLHRAEIDELLTYDGTRLVFRHPLIRSAIYHSASVHRRAAIHRALAAAFDGQADQHRRAWHLGQAAVGHDERAAAELERSAEHAALRGGPAAAMSALSRAAELTADGPRRGRRLWGAALAAVQGGLTAAATDLLDRAVREPHLEEADRIALAAVRAIVAEFTGSTEDALELIRPWIPRALRVDRRLFTPTVAMYGDLGLRANRPETWADLAGWLAEVPLDEPEDEVLRLLHRLSLTRTGHPLRPPSTGRAPASGEVAPDLGGAGVHDGRDGFEAITDPATLTLAGGVARQLGEHELSRRLYREAGRLARAGGSLGGLAWNLEYQAADELARGRFGLAEAHAEEGCQFAADASQPNTACRNRGLLALCAALRGRPDAARLATEVLAEASGRKLCDAMAYARRALGLIELVAGRHGEAARHFESIGDWTADPPPDLAMGVLPDLVEALVRAGENARAADATTRYEKWTGYTARLEPTGTGPASAAAGAESAAPGAGFVADVAALVARCRALVGADGDADGHYAEALRLHAMSDSPFECARTQLLRGEQLRRDRRRNEAQVHLREAADSFRRMGARAWAARAEGELRATGESTRPRASGELSRGRTDTHTAHARAAAETTELARATADTARARVSDGPTPEETSGEATSADAARGRVGGEVTRRGATGESRGAAGEYGDALGMLTPQELRVSLAVAEGLTNREIAARLFLSPRTVDYHLRKVFQKAGIASRAELIRLVLAERLAS